MCKIFSGTVFKFSVNWKVPLSNNSVLRITNWTILTSCTQEMSQDNWGQEVEGSMIL